MKTTLHTCCTLLPALIIMLAVSCTPAQPKPTQLTESTQQATPPFATDSVEKSNVQTTTPETLLTRPAKPMQAKPAKKPEVDLHSAVMTNNINAVKQHIAAKSDLNVKDPMGGSTPLITAALFGKTEIARILIEAGANLDARNNDGSTALFTAAFFCRTEIVKQLLKHNADKSIRNKYGQTALEALQTPFEQIKPVYDMLGNALAPMGLTIDYAQIEQSRPVIAEMLK
jgi:uncharacterized protein